MVRTCRSMVNLDMLIGIDGNEANIKNRVGVNVYAFELLKAIYNLRDEWGDKYKFVIYLKNKPNKDLPEENENWKYKILSPSPMWVITKLMPHLIFSRTKPKIFFTPSHYAPPVIFMPKVCSIMDLGYLKFSKQFKKYDYWQLRLWTAWSIYTSKFILAISNATKNNITQRYSIAKNKTYVSYLAYDKNKFNMNINKNIKNKHKIHSQYVLFLSTLKPSKNITGLLEAWNLIKDKFPETKLVIAGKKGWLYEDIFSLVKKLGLENSVVFTDFVKEKDKPALIAGAKVFVLPSFWEGFGLDVLNAFAVGVPVIVSNKGSLPEIAGDAGIIIDPNDYSQIAKSIGKVLSMNEIEYNKIVQKGLKRAEYFSWDKTARKTLEVFDKIYK